MNQKQYIAIIVVLVILLGAAITLALVFGLKKNKKCPTPSGSQCPPNQNCPSCKPDCSTCGTFYVSCGTEANSCEVSYPTQPDGFSKQVNTGGYGVPTYIVNVAVAPGQNIYGWTSLIQTIIGAVQSTYPMANIATSTDLTQAYSNFDTSKGGQIPNGAFLDTANYQIMYGAYNNFIEAYQLPAFDPNQTVGVYIRVPSFDSVGNVLNAIKVDLQNVGLQTAAGYQPVLLL